jgi:hypothetical protein
LAGADGTTAGDIHAADDLRDEILSLNDNTVNSRYRARLVRQGDLWDTGVKLGKMLGKNDNGEYYGGKWGVHLRAPDLWFWLLEQTGQKWAPLGDIAEVRFGVKSGKDEFFFPKDISSDALSTYEDAKEFESHYGVKRKDVSSGKVKIVSCGKGRGEVRAIESEYLEPEVHSLMEIDGFTVGPEDCSRQILLVSKKKDELKGTHVLDYIEWGESQGFNTNATCIARVTESREWYDLTGHERAPVFWPKERQYKHISSLNESCLVGNCRLYEIYPPDEMCNPLLWGGLLNSSFAIISSLQFGRPVGNEGNWSTMVVDVNMMLVPDPRKATKKQLDRVAAAFEKMKGRKVLQFLSERRMREMAYTQAGKADQLRNLSDECELDMPDRRELDDAVLDLLGVKTKKERDDIIRYLYGYLREFYEDTRRKEEKAIANKKRAGKKGAASPRDIAAQIF